MPSFEPYFIGVDLAQVEDFTAVSLLDREPALDEGGVPALDGQCRPLYRYYLDGLERYERNLSYPDLVERIGAVIRHPAVQSRGYPLVAIDSSGVGRAATDQLIAANLPAKLVPVTLTSGMGMVREKWNRTGLTAWRVSKTHLIGSMLLALETGRLKFAPGLKLVPALEAELRDFRVSITRSANQTYGARSGQHDDLVISVALACWLENAKGKSITVN